MKKGTVPSPALLHDVAIIGGGPAGATAAMCCARRGLSTILLEKSRHPRFHIGESLLPRNQTLFRELGLTDRMEQLPRVPKYGASFVMGDGTAPTDFWFAQGPDGEESSTFSIERARLDCMLVEAAREAGADVREAVGVLAIDHLSEGKAALSTNVGPIRARVVIDASGQSAVLGRHLGTRRTIPDLQRVAYFAHFTGVERRAGKLGGSPINVMCEEGWFWVIPLDDSRTSVGLVARADLARSAGIGAAEVLAWALARSPFMRGVMARASGPERNMVAADFSYRCEPFAGPGYFLVGDAATFVDPIFSTGVCMAMMSGVKAAECCEALLAGGRRPESIRRDYSRYVDGSSAVFFSLVRNFYRHGFREMFLNGSGPCGVHRAILSLLAGHVFPRPVFGLRWRMALFEVLLDIHEKWRPLVPHRRRFSLISSSETAHPLSAARTRAPGLVATR